MDSKFANSSFFDISHIFFSDIFVESEMVWESILKTESFIKQLFDSGKLAANYKDNKYVYVGEGTQIMEGAFIKGPAVIGKNCIIGHAALIREYCLLGDNVRIGHSVEVKNSIFLNDSVAAHLNYIGDSIIGGNVNISGGAIIANFRLDKAKVTIKYNNDKIQTNLEKFGAIVGDNSNIGVNAVLNPGTVIGKNSLVYPLVSASGYYPDNSRIK